MRIAFTGGGTGGHVFPNIAVIKEIRERKIAECFYVGGKNSVEQRLILKLNIPFYGISVGKLRRYWDFRNFTDAFKILKGIFDAYRILKNKKPDVLFSKGGYVSVPVALAAWMSHIPVFIHESDVTPGLATKICARFARKIFLSFEESRQFFRGKKTKVVGNPVRKNILNGNREKGFKLTGFSHNKPVILIMGGSSGAQSLNEMIYEILPELLQEAQVIHVTGLSTPSATADKPAFAPTSGATADKQFEFLEEELADCYAIADLVVSRAGSGSIFEVVAANKPLILVPLPKISSRGDQIENAKTAVLKGWALSVDQNAGAHELLKVIKKFLVDKKLRETLMDNQKKCRFRDAAERIVKMLMTNGRKW